MRRYFTRVNQAKVLKYAREIVERGLQVRTLLLSLPRAMPLDAGHGKGCAAVHSWPLPAAENPDLMGSRGVRCAAAWLQRSVMEIDDRWQAAYGDLEFDSAKFPDAPGMVRQLHAMGFKVGS